MPTFSGPHASALRAIVLGMSGGEGISLPQLGRMAVVPVSGSKPKVIFHGAMELNAAFAKRLTSNVTARSRSVAYDEQLAQRIRDALAGDRGITERKMFGGIAFLRHGLMFVGVSNSSLMARIGKSNHADSLARKHVRPMDFTGKPMLGYVFIDAPGLKTEAQLRFWLERCKQFVSTLPPKGAK